MELPYIEKTNVGGNQFVIRDGAARKMLSGQYDPTEEYVKGDIIIYESVLYECISDTTVTGLWDLSKWSEITIVEMYNKLNRNLITANAAINELNVKISYTRSEALNNIIPEKVTLSANNNNRYYLNGNVCTILYDFEVTYVVTSNERIFNNIPTPWADNVWVTLSKDSFTDNTGEDASVMLVRSGSESFLAVAWRELKVGRYIGSIVYQTNITI